MRAAVLFQDAAAKNSSEMEKMLCPKRSLESRTAYIMKVKEMDADRPKLNEGGALALHDLLETVRAATKCLRKTQLARSH
jgi:hypothetical protein